MYKTYCTRSIGLSFLMMWALYLLEYCNTLCIIICICGVNYYHRILILQCIKNVIVSTSNWLHIKSNISFLDTFHTNFSHEYINCFEFATRNSSVLIRCWNLVLFSSLQRRVLNSEKEGNLSFAFRNTLRIADLPCSRLSFLSFFMEYTNCKDRLPW